MVLPIQKLISLINEECMQIYHASWHKSCDELYKPSSALYYSKKRYNEEMPLARKDHDGVIHLLIAICVYLVGMQQVMQTIRSRRLHVRTQQILDKAGALGEDRIHMLLAKGDVVAIEAKYHQNCYTGFNRRYNCYL